MKIRLFQAVMLWLWASVSMAQTDVISGNAKTYAGDTLRMYALSDYINQRETLIASAPVDKNGNFSFNIKTREISQAYIDLTVFKCILYLQPGTRQTIVLPEKQTIRPEDEMNPFFRKYEFYPKLINPDSSDLNILIPAFDKIYTQALNRIITSQYSVSKAQTDSLEAKIAAKFAGGGRYFQEYMRYRFAMLDNTAYHRNRNIVISELFSGKDVLYRNPAYNELFADIFTNMFFNMKNDLPEYQNIMTSIQDRSYSNLRSQLTAQSKIGSEQLADYIILKGIKDAYHSDTISKATLLALADSLALKSKTKEFREIASHMIEDFTSLMCGYPAPDITVADRSNNQYELASFAGKFSYLIFFNPNSYTAQNDLGMLMQIRSDIPKDALEIVMVFVSQNKKQYLDFIDQQTDDLGFDIFWYNGNKEMLRKYNVKAFPMYYLINPDGNLSMNPAPSPSENFMDKFQNIFRSWKIEQQRRDYKGRQGIR